MEGTRCCPTCLLDVKDMRERERERERESPNSVKSGICNVISRSHKNNERAQLDFP